MYLKELKTGIQANNFYAYVPNSTIHSSHKSQTETIQISINEWLSRLTKCGVAIQLSYQL